MTAVRVIAAAELEALLADLIPIGLEEDGATTRLAWTDEDEQAAGWFARRAEAIGRRMERDPAGNLWACPDVPPPWWAVGSHLDSVRGGGRFDGALGVAAGFAVAERLPVAVVSFADEEGARFNTPTFGSRALVGRLDVDDAVDRVDEHGATLGDAMAAAGVDPDRLGDAPAWLERVAEEAGVGLELRTAAWSPGTEFPDAVRDALLAGLRPPKPRLVCYAGHDAGVIAAARPAGMVLVRNETGVSHSPAEEVSLDDAAVAANALLAAAVELAR